MNTADKEMFRGTTAFIAYLFFAMVVLFLPQVSDQPVLQALFPLPFPNGTVTYYAFVIFFFWIIGIPTATWWLLIRPMAQFAKSKGFHRG